MWTREVVIVTAVVVAVVIGFALLLWFTYAWWVAALFLIEAPLIVAGSWYLQSRRGED